jgi:hypothetical protein
MAVKVRRDHEIFEIDGGWFHARWHFSFDTYVDPEYVRFGSLRVFNDDRLTPGAIWPLHPHRDIEGLTYVVEGLFRHQDDVGGPPGPLPAGSVQRMTLGRGAWHSEQNGSGTEPMRFIQMWILPSEAGLEPGVEQKTFTTEDRTDRLLEVIGVDGGEAVLVHGDAHVFVARLNAGVSVDHHLGAGRGVYLYLIEGAVEANGERMGTGDAAQVTDEDHLAIAASDPSELILVDVGLS